MALINSLMTWRMKQRFHQIELFIRHPLDIQKECLHSILYDAKDTEWGKKYSFNSIETIQDFQHRIPLQDYESMKADIHRSMKGEQNIFWHSTIKWFAKSSGTTNDKSKFIPVSVESLKDCHYKAGKDMLSIYCNQVEDTHIFTGKSFTTGGSNQIINDKNGFYQGDLSAILIDNLPMWVHLFRAPEKEIALMGNWEEKIKKMAESTVNENITSLSGVPSWSLVLFEYMIEKYKAKNMKEIWPNMELYMHGGIKFNPYQKRFKELLPDINYLEIYNASEGFFGIQFELGVSDFLLMLDYGIFYEFIPLEDYYENYKGKTLLLNEIEINKSYVVVITTNAGLWRYIIGDTIEFTSVKPFRFKISGRTKFFINAFGEELVLDNTEKALEILQKEKMSFEIAEYLVAPVYLNNQQSGYHEWLIEFNEVPENIEDFENELDEILKKLNSDYDAKRFNNLLLSNLKVKVLSKDSFYKWLKSKNKLGGQNKVPKLCNDRIIADQILKISYDS